MLLCARTLEEKWILCSNVNCQILDSYYEEGVSFTWDGEVLNNKAHGHGTAIRYINNELHSTFVGNYENGIRVGHGKLSWADGRELECEFTNNQATGQGKQIDPNGDVYTGQFINYILHGNGKIEKANGVVMEGSFVLGNLYTGKSTSITGAITYYYKGGISQTQQFDKTSNYSPVIGQTITEFFDTSWQRCEAKDALYYRRIKYKAPNIPDGEVKDYYIDGQLQSVFTPIYIDYADSEKNFYEGKFVSYFENGNKEQEYTYYNSQADGKVMFYYQNGQVFSICDYEGGVKNGEYYEYYQTECRLSNIPIYCGRMVAVLQLRATHHFEYECYNHWSVYYRQRHNHHPLA
jgi:antitoxin component YwqK of YwqJK toxin-antitoxin module